MTWTRWWTARSLVVLALAAGCGGSAEPPPQYGYGDMFQGQDEDTRYRGGGGGAYATSDTAASYAEPGAAYAEERMAVGESEAMPSPEPADDDGGGWRSREASAPPPAPVATAPQGGPSPQPAAQNVPTGGATSTTPAQTGAAVQGPDHATVPDQEPVTAGPRERRAPMLIYEAGLTIATRTVSEQVDEAVRIAHELGGVIVSQDDAGVMVRVPAARFREALGLYEALGDVLARRVTAQDVSEAVRDTRVRLQNAINLRDRLRELLRSATTVPESLAIERELERLNETIALLQGQLESLEERVAYSTITVRFQPVQDTSEVPRELFRLPFGWLDSIGLPGLLSL